MNHKINQSKKAPWYVRLSHYIAYSSVRAGDTVYRLSVNNENRAFIRAYAIEKNITEVDSLIKLLSCGINIVREVSEENIKVYIEEEGELRKFKT